MILFWQFSHFVVLEGFDGRNFYLNDPATGRRTLSAQEFTKDFSGIALRFERGAGFKPGGKRPGLLSQLGGLLSGSRSVLAGVIACGLMLTLLALIVPASLGVFVDGVLENHGSWADWWPPCWAAESSYTSCPCSSTGSSSGSRSGFR